MRSDLRRDDKNCHYDDLFQVNSMLCVDKNCHFDVCCKLFDCNCVLKGADGISNFVQRVVI